jgi:tellurium resistance protein TerD
MSTAINLVKGAKVDLTKTNPNVKKFKVGLGWNPNTAVGGTFDVDVSAFVLGENGKRVDDNHFVFYNNLKSPRDFVVHNGDNTTGEGDGDDETLVVDFSKVSAEDKQIVFVVTIHDAIAKNQNFGQVSGSYIRISDEATGTEILKYDLNEDYSIETAMIFGKIYEKDGEFKFEAVGTGMKGGLQDYLNQY